MIKMNRLLPQQTFWSGILVNEFFYLHSKRRPVGVDAPYDAGSGEEVRSYSGQKVLGAITYCRSVIAPQNLLTDNQQNRTSSRSILQCQSAMF